MPPNVLDGRPSPGRAQKFFRLTSLRMDISTAWSATIFLRRAFSFSNSFKCFIVSAFMPPYWLQPAVEGRLAYAESPGDLGVRSVRFAQLADDLLWSVPLVH